MWFAKQIFCVSCFAPFRKEDRFLYKTSKEFYEILSRVDDEKENCAKCEKCVEVILSSFCVCIIFCEICAKREKCVTGIMMHGPYSLDRVVYDLKTIPKIKNAIKHNHKTFTESSRLLDTLPRCPHTGQHIPIPV